MPENQILSLQNYKSGLMTSIPPDRIPDDAFSDCQNIDLTNNYIPIKCKGRKNYNPTGITTKPIRGLFVYTRTDGTKYYVVACGGKIYYSVAGSKTFTAYQIGGNDLTITEDSDVEIVQYNNILYIVNGIYPIITNGGYATSRMIKIDNTTVSELTDANIPKGGQYIIVHKERLFIAGNDDQANGLNWSEPYLPEDFLPDYGVNYDYVGKDDGENITGIISYQDYVYVFKPHNIYRYSTQGDITQWQSHRVDTRYGALYHRTIKEYNGFLAYLSNDGVIMFDGINARIASENIENIINNLPQIKAKFYQWYVSTTKEFDTGYFDIDMIKTDDNQITLLPQETAEDWAAGTLTNVEVDDITGGLRLLQSITGNYCLTGTVIAESSFGGNVAANVNDGNHATYWQSAYDNRISYNLINLNASRNIKLVKIYGVRILTATGQIAGTVTITLAEKLNSEESRCYGVNYNTSATGTVDIVFVVNSDIPTFEAIQITYINDNVSHSLIVAEMEVYEFSYPATGNFVSRVFDFQDTPGEYGNLMADIDIPNNTHLLFKTSSSADNITYETPVYIGGLCDGLNGGKINSTPQRYLKWIAEYTANAARDLTPVIYGCYIGSIYTSPKKDLGGVPSVWGNFESAYTTNGQKISFWMRSATSLANLDTAVWVEQFPGTAISNITLRRYIQFQLRLDILTKTDLWNSNTSILETTIDNIPAVESVNIGYYTTAKLLQPCSVVWKKNYWLNVVSEGNTINDTAYILCNSGEWLKRTVKYNNIYVVDEDTLLSGSSEPVGQVIINDIGIANDYYVSNIPNTYGSIVRIGNYIYAKIFWSLELWRYDLVNMNWTRLADMPTIGNPMMFMLATDGTDVYMMNYQTTTFYVFTIATGLWTELATPPGAAAGGMACADNLYFWEFKKGDSFRKYTIGGAWSTGVSPTVTSTESVGIVSDGTYVYLLVCTPTGNFFRYTIATNTWVSLTDLTGAIFKITIPYGLANLNVIGTYVYALLGSGELWRYDITATTWYQLATAPTEINNYTNYLTNDGINLYAVRGNGFSDVYKYTISQNKWNVYAIDSYFTTKKFELMEMTKVFRKLFINYQANADWKLYYSIDGGDFTEISIAAKGVVTTVKKILTGIARGLHIQFKIRQYNTDNGFEFHRLDLEWQGWRQLNSE